MQCVRESNCGRSLVVQVQRPARLVFLKTHMTLPSFIYLLFLPAAALGADEHAFAFIREGQIFLSAENGTPLRQIGNDPRTKADLGWDRASQRLSYRVDPDTDEKARLAVIDLSGRVVSEVAIRPRTDPPTEGMRAVEGLTWTSEGKARIWGSINPTKCEMFDFDIVTRQKSNWQGGECGTFVASPDGKHIAELGPAFHFTPDEDLFEYLQIDNKEDFYPASEDSPKILVVAGPVWSPDSQMVALLEKRKIGDEAAVTIVSLTGAFTRVPVSLSILESPSLAWVGMKVVAGRRGVDELQIDSVTKRIGAATADITDELDRRKAAADSLEARHKRIQSLVEKLGGRVGIDLLGYTAKQ